MTRLVAAQDVSMEALREGMCAGFSDYAVPMTLSSAEFAFMMRQRGLDAAASRVMVAGGVVQSVWMVSVSGHRAYLISSATRPEARGQGFAGKLAEASFDGLRHRGVTHFQTEVMEGNPTAYRLYERMGLAPNRMLDCYDLPQLQPRAGGVGAEICPAKWQDIAQAVSGCRDWEPSWQNDDAALGRVADELEIVALRDQTGLAGYAVAIRPTRALAQIAVRRDARGEGVGRALVAALEGRCEGRLRLLNADRSDAGFAAFMRRIGASKTVGQFELAGPV